MAKRLLICLLFCGFLSNAQSAPVDIDIVRKVAKNFMMIRSHHFASAQAVNTEIKEVLALPSDDVKAYAINFTDGGFIIVAADNASIPVLGYSFEGNFTNDQIPPQVAAWMQVYYNKISDVRQNNIPPTTEIIQEWDNLIKGESVLRSNSEVTPLLNTTWDQGARYNSLCPADPMGPGGHVWSGCVATAMSQIINYWRYPLQGTGSHGYYSDYGYLSVDFGASNYDYNQMNNSIGGEENYEMAEIQYHCGVAVDMMYSPDGSGAYSEDAANALKDYFSYSQDLGLELKQDYSESEWANLLINNLDNGWPMYYHGFGSGGHAFNVDGYQGTDYFHFNWGWSGSYNGYYYLSNLNPGGNDFTWGQGAIVNFYPAQDSYPYYCSGVTTLNRHNGTIEDGSGPVNNYTSGLSCGWLISPDDSITGLTLSFQKFNLASGDVLNVFDGENSSCPLIGSFTGSTIPSVINATNGKLYLEFLTEGNQGSGFRAVYNSSLASFCPGTTTFHEPAGTFSDGSGTYDYRNNSFCKYIIAPDSAAGIIISFDQLDTEPLNDKIKIYDMVSQQLITEVSGSELPDDIYIPSPKAFVLFLSNNMVNGSGWQISYNSTLTPTNDQPHPRKVNIYCSPNPADDWLRIDIRSRLAEKLIIEIISPEGKSHEIYNDVPSLESFVITSDISNYKPGLYLIRYRTISETGTTKVVIK
ncbi:MAG TPA: C10 family peptidase [Lentimicrobium sp.]|nr:C10 family peptidase [Lentimicrobium sp.]